MYLALLVDIDTLLYLILINVTKCHHLYMCINIGLVYKE